MAYSDTVKNYCGTTDGDWATYDLLGTTKGDVWFHEGVRYFINRVKTTSPDSLFYFTVTRESTQDGTEFLTDVSNDTKYINPHSDAKYGDVLHVYVKQDSKRYMASEIDSALAPYIGDTNSIHYATKSSPAYYMLSGYLHISTPGSIKGFTQIYYDTAFTFGVGDTESTSIANFPEQYGIFPILYTAKQIIKYKLSVMRDRLADVPDYAGYTEIADGIPDTISDGYGEGWNAVKFYIESEEDAELAALKMNQLTSEQQTFMTDYQWLQGQLQEVKEEYEQQFGAVFGVVGG